MRTTIRIDDDLMRELKVRAHKEGTSLARLVNRAIRRGLKPASAERKLPPFREKTFKMGQPTVNLDKALTIASALEDEEVLCKFALRK